MPRSVFATRWTAILPATMLAAAVIPFVACSDSTSKPTKGNSGEQSGESGNDTSGSSGGSGGGKSGAAGRPNDASTKPDISFEELEAGPHIEGLKTLEIRNAPESLVLKWGEPPTTQFQVIGTKDDGSTIDLTSVVVWNNEGIVGADATFQPPWSGTFEVQARASDVLSNKVTIKVTLEGNVLTNVPDNAPELFAGASSFEPQVKYPLNRTLFPGQLPVPEFHLTHDLGADKLIGRVHFKNEHVDLHAYGVCVPPPNAKFAGCELKLSDRQSLAKSLAAATELGASDEGLEVTVSLATEDGSQVGTAAPMKLSWSSAPFNGGVYYWSAYALLGGGTTDAGEQIKDRTFIMRYDLEDPAHGVESFYDSRVHFDEALPDLKPKPEPYQQCFGCHTISNDGNKMALSFGGSSSRDWKGYGIMDIGTREYDKIERISATTTERATMTAFNKDATQVVNVFMGGKLVLRDAKTLEPIETLFESVIEKPELMTLPFWGADGSKLAFVSWRPLDNKWTKGLIEYNNYLADRSNGDMVTGARIWITDHDGSKFGTPKVLVDRVEGKTETYPALSDDSKWVLFNESDCEGPPTHNGYYGTSPCDGYDDPSAMLKLVSSEGGKPVGLDKANGDQTWTNSWPRFSPAHGTFRGKSIYWLTFSSRRPYGLVSPGSKDGTTNPQIWFAAVLLDPDGKNPTVDPSTPPFHMTNQALDFGNHIPQWVKKVVPKL